MPHGPTFFPSKGVCIYCRAANVELTKEHVVPYSLGGVHVIRGASCSACAGITKKFEDKVARGLWGDARVAFNAPSRRKKERNTLITMPDVLNESAPLQIPATEYPAGLVFYQMGLPGLLQSLPEDQDISNGWKLVMIDDDKRRSNFLEKYPDRKLALSFRHVPYEFGQLLCKIAHCQLLTVFDLDSFNPLCVPYITGQKTNVSYLVGGTDQDVTPLADIGYSLNITALTFSKVKLILIVNIRLCANTYAPEYQVVAGEVIGEKSINHIIQRYGFISS